MISLTSRTSKVKGLISKSTKVIDIFTKTKTDLEDINNSITLEQELISKEVAELTAHSVELDKLTLTNNKVIKNINKIIE